MDNIAISNGSQVVARFRPFATDGDILETVFVVTTSPSLSFNSMGSPTGSVSGNELSVPIIKANVYDAQGELIEDNSEEIVIIVNVLDVDSDILKVYLNASTTTMQQTTQDDSSVFDIRENYNLFKLTEGTFLTVSDNLGDHTATQRLDMSNYFIINEHIPEFDTRGEAYTALGPGRKFRYTEANTEGNLPAIDTTNIN